MLRNLVGKSEDGSLIKEFEASHGTVTRNKLGAGCGYSATKASYWLTMTW